MPEYPEVNTIIKHISGQQLLNQKIIKINIIDNKIIKNCTNNDFIKFLILEKIKYIYQIGKYIIFCFTNDKILEVHLRMEGKLFVIRANESVNKFCMIEFYLENNIKLIYEDTRKFGTFNVYKNINELMNANEIKKLGLQPLDSKLDSNYLYKKFHNKNKSIKSMLLDQTIIAGIGNIYADEILFASKIHPLAKARSLTKTNLTELIKNIRRIIDFSIRMNGTTVFTYKFGKNHSGSFQKYLKIYNKQHQLCPVCKTKIDKIRVNGRGTCFCPNCQKL